MKRSKSILLLFVFSVLSFLSTFAQILPLQEQSWANETFRKRFLGTYGVNSEIEPSINQAENELFQMLIPLVQQDQVEQAIAALKTFMQSAEEISAAIDFTLGNLYFQQSRLDQAATSYQSAIKKFPTFSRAYENLGRIAVMKGDFNTARAYLVQAIELGGPQSDLYGLLGFSYLNLEKPSSALLAYDAASLLDPENKDWQLGRAQALVQSERNEEAVPLLKELVSQDLSNRNLILSISNAYLDMGEFSKSALYLELLNRTGNANNASLLLLGDIYMNQSLPNLALPVYQQAMKTKQDQLALPSALRIAKVYVERGLYGPATEVIADIERLYSSSLTDKNELELLNLKSRISLSEGKSKEALALLEQIIAVDPMNGDALITLANLHWELQDIESAAYYFGRAQTVDSVKFRALVDNARMLVAEADYREAYKLLARAYDLNPSENLKEYTEAVEQIANR